MGKWAITWVCVDPQSHMAASPRKMSLEAGLANFACGQRLYQWLCARLPYLCTPSYPGLTSSISWLLMPWQCKKPGHQHPWYWLCIIFRTVFSMRKDFNFLCHISMESAFGFAFCSLCIMKMKFNCISQLMFMQTLFTQGQFWPSGIVVACVCMCVRVSINHELVHAIIHQPFKLGSPNLNQRCKRPWLRSLLFCGVIDSDLQGQIELESQNLPRFGLVSLSGR